MTKYLQSRPGSIEEVAANLSKFATESEYQAMFKKELEKAGKGIGAMTPAEKKAFFNKIDNKYKAKNEETINEKKNYKRDSNFFVNDKTDTLKKMSGRQGYNKSTLTDYLAQKSNKKENDVYFDDTDLVYKSKTVLKNAETKTVDQMLKALQKEAVDNPYAVGMAVAKNENIKEGRYEVTGTVTYQGVSGEDEVTVVVDAMDKMDAEDVADDMIDDLRRAKKIGPKRGGQVKRFYPFDVEYTRKKEGLVDKMMEKVDEPYAVGMAQAMKATGDKPPLKKSTITKAHDIAKSIEKDQKESVSESMFTDTKNDGQGKSVSQIQQMLKREIQKGNFVGADKYTIIEPGLTPGMKQDMTIKHNDLLQAIKKHGATGFRVMPMGESIEKDEVTEAKYPHKMYSKDGKEVEAKTPEDHKKYADMGYIHKNETHSFMTKDMNQKKKDAKGEKDVIDPEPKIKGLKSFKEMRHYSKSKKENMDATISKDQDPKNNEPEKLKVKAMTGTQATAVDTTPEVEYKN